MLKVTKTTVKYVSITTCMDVKHPSIIHVMIDQKKQDFDSKTGIFQDAMNSERPTDTVPAHLKSRIFLLRDRGKITTRAKNTITTLSTHTFTPTKINVCLPEDPFKKILSIELSVLLNVSVIQHIGRRWHKDGLIGRLQHIYGRKKRSFVSYGEIRDEIPKLSTSLFPGREKQLTYGLQINCLPQTNWKKLAEKHLLQ